MRIAVLGASGGTGRELTQQALARGHEVTALVRTPASFRAEEPPALVVAKADVFDPETVRNAIAGADVLISALGVVNGNRPGTLLAGAEAVLAAPRIIWLGALGAPLSRSAVSPLYALLLQTFVGSEELGDKAAADERLLQAGATLFHAGILGNGPVSARARSIPLTSLRRTILPTRVSRATVASVMLDEAEVPTYTSEILVPVG